MDQLLLTYTLAEANVDAAVRATFALRRSGCAQYQMAAVMMTRKEMFCIQATNPKLLDVVVQVPVAHQCEHQPQRHVSCIGIC